MLSGVFVLDALILAAMFCAVVLAGTQMARPFLVGLAGNVPLIGAGLASAVDRILGAWQGALAGPADAVLPLLTSLLQWLTGQAHYYLLNVVRLAQRVHDAFWRLQQLSVPHLLDLAAQRLEGLITDARAFALQQVQALAASAAHALSDAVAGFNRLIGLEVARAQEAESALQQFATSEVRRVEQNAAQAVLQVAHDAQLLSQRAEAVAAQLVAGERLIREAAQNVIARDLEAIEQQVSAQIPEAIGTVQKDVTALRQQTEAQIPELERNVSAEIQGILNSPQWLLLKSLTESGEEIVKSGVQELVSLAFKAAREQIANIPTWTRTQEANIEVIFDVLKRDLAAK